MKQSKNIGLKTLYKRYIEDEKLWGEYEFIEDRNTKMVKKASEKKVSKINVSDNLIAFKDEISSCMKCPLGKTRINFVFGDGNPKADLMFIGEGPGFDEDHKGLPFIGRAGQLLTKIIESIGLKRQDVYIANIVKCHPMVDPSDPEKRGNDRPPKPEEIEKCIPYLFKQIEIIKPKVICTLGGYSSKTLLKVETPISKLRGQYYDFSGTVNPVRDDGGNADEDRGISSSNNISSSNLRGTPAFSNGIKLMPTYHPAALLRNPSLKKDVWEDMKKIRSTLKLNK